MFCCSKCRLLPAAAHRACGCEPKHRIQGPGDICGLSSPLWQGPAAGVILCQGKVGYWHRQAIGGVGHQDCPFEGAGTDSSYRACTAGACFSLHVGRLHASEQNAQCSGAADCPAANTSHMRYGTRHSKLGENACASSGSSWGLGLLGRHLQHRRRDLGGPPVVGCSAKLTI